MRSIMEATTCSNIKEALIRRLSDEIVISTVMGQCVFSLPIKGLEERTTDVFVEKMLGESFRVHDAGITTSHLLLRAFT